MKMQTISDEIRGELFLLQDLSYRDFQSALMPTVDKTKVIGIRTPVLRKFAKKLEKEGKSSEFIRDLPHIFYEENNLHGFILQNIKDFDLCIEKLEVFLPYIDNWATCDMLRPYCFGNNKHKLYPYIEKWISHDLPYVKRFGIGMLNSYFSNDGFDKNHLELVCKIRSEEYYVNMMIAWYFATVLSFHYDAAVYYLETNRLDKWVHNKAIQKACESLRISNEQKIYLKKLKR